MKDYFYVNSRLVREYSDQLKLSRRNMRISKQSTKTLISVYPNHERSKELSASALSECLLAQNLSDELARRGLVRKSRPFVMSSHYSTDMDEPFVLETILATKVVFDKRQLSSLNSIRELAVWVSDPDPSQFADREFAWHGTFLLLPEANFDDGVYHTVFSGCSALQMLYNGITGKKLKSPSFDETLGRASHLHPVHKLVQLGGTRVGERKVEALYRMRYLTDEQCFLYNGRKRRVNDLLGYPIYLAETL